MYFCSNVTYFWIIYSIDFKFEILHFSLIKSYAAAKSLQSCLTLCDPIDGSTPGSPVPGILQARTLEWVAISFSSARKWKVNVKSLSRVQPSATPWTAAYQASPYMGFSRQEYWSGLPLPSPKLCMGIRKNRNPNIFNKASPFSKLKKKFYLNHNYCTILYWFLPNINTNQL